MRRATRAIDEAVRNVEGLAPVHVVRDKCCGVSDRLFLDVVKRCANARNVVHVRFTTDDDDARDDALNNNKNTTLVDAKDCGVFRAHEKPLDGLLGKLREILGASDDDDDDDDDDDEDERGKNGGAHREEADDDTNNATRNRNTTNNIRSGIFGYAPKDSEQRTVVFLDDVSCVSFIYGEQAVITFVREVQRMPRARGVVVRERSTTSRWGNRSRHRGGSRGVCDVLANDASCSCEMTIYRQNSNDRSSGSSDAASQQKTLFTVEAKRGATRKTRETDVVQFVKVPSSRIGNGNCSQCIALDYTSIDDALRNERDIQKAREYSRAQKLTDKLNKFSTFNLGIETHATKGNQRERDAKHNVKLAYQHEGGGAMDTNGTQSNAENTFRQTLPRDAGGLQGRRGQGHGEKLKNLLEYERDEVDEHDYGSGVDTDEEIDDLDDF